MNRNNLQELVIIAGPSTAGKTTLLKRLMSGEIPEIQSIFSINDLESWSILKAVDWEHKLNWWRKLPRKLILHYDILRPIRRFGYSLTEFGSDPVLKKALRYPKIKIATLVVSRELVLSRIGKREKFNKGEASIAKKGKLVLDIYNDAAKYRSLCAGWFEYCRGIAHNSHWLYEGLGTDQELRAYELSQEQGILGRIAAA